MSKGSPNSSIRSDSRLGIHYFPDTMHYREADLQSWLPVLQEMGASWLVLRSDLDRAIPEHFIRGLKQARIEPFVQFSLSLDHLPDLKEVGMLLDVYGRWGVRYASFYERPNARSAWPAASWAQQDLVERFLDRYLPLANLSMQSGIAPVFPPLEPGGSYWDTAFLHSALQSIQRRKQELLLQSLVLSAYAWRGASGLEGSDGLNWGAGGPERWPQARPYHTPATSQDQRGFRIFDWYLAIARSVLQDTLPIILLQAGFPGDPQRLAGETAWSAESVHAYHDIARLLAGDRVDDPQENECELEPIPDNIIAGTFWLLGADLSSPYASQAWFQEENKTHPALPNLRAWRRVWQQRIAQQNAKSGSVKGAGGSSIEHYLLLPGYEWGVSDWYLEVIRPFVKKHRPTIGFSVEEAEKAVRVTVVGSEHNFPEDTLVRLEQAGCLIEQIGGDGTNIASELAER